MYESMQNELANKKASAQMDAQAKIQNSDNMANAFLGVAGAVQQGIDIYAQSKVESEYSKVMTELEAGQMQYMNPDNENAVGDYTDFVTNTLDQHASNFGPILKSYFNKNRSTIINNAVSSFSSDYLKAVSKANAENFKTNYANAIRACASGQDYNTIEQKKIYRPVFDENGMRMTSEAIDVGAIYDTNTGDAKKDRFNGLRNYLYGIACLNNMSMDEAKAWVEDNTDKIEQDLVVQELPTTIEKLFRGQGVDANGEPIPSMSMDEVIDYLKSGFVMDGEMPYTGKKMTSDEALVYRNEIEKFGTQIAKDVQDENSIKIKGGLNGFITKCAENDVPLTSDRIFGEMSRQGIISKNEDGTYSHYGIRSDDWNELVRIGTMNDRLEFVKNWVSNPNVRVDENGDGLIDLADVPQWALSMIGTKGSDYYVNSYYDYQGWTFSDDSAKATENALSLVDSVIEYEAYTSKGLEVPETNYIQGLVNSAMKEAYGEDWRKKNIPVDEFNSIVSKVAGSTLAKFKTDLTTSGDTYLKYYYSEGLDSMQSMLTAEKKSSSSGSGSISNDDAYTALYGDGIGVGTGFGNIRLKVKDESKFGAYDYQKVNDEYEKGNYEYIDSMLKKDGYNLNELSAQQLADLRLGKYESNKDRIDILLSRGWKYVDENGNQFAQSYELSKKVLGQQSKTTEVMRKTEFMDSVKDEEAFYQTKLKELAVYKANPLDLGQNGLTETSVEIQRISVTNMAAQLGLLSDVAREDGLITVEELESIFEENQVNIWKKRADSDTDYMNTLLVNADVLLANKIALSEGKRGEDIDIQYNLEASKKFYEKLKSSYETSMSANKKHPMYDSTNPQSSWESLVSATNSKVKNEVGDFSDEFGGVWKPAVSIGDPISDFIKGIQAGNSYEYMIEFVKSSSRYSASDTHKITDKKMHELLNYLVDNPTLASNVGEFVEKMPNDTIKEMAWNVIFDVCGKGKEEGWTWPQTIGKVEEDFAAAFGSQLKESMLSEIDGSSRVYAEFGSGVNVSDDAKGMMETYKLDASNGRFVKAGINNLIDTYYNKRVRTDKRFELDMKNMSGDELYNFAIICALDANGLDTTGLDPRADNFTDVLEGKFDGFSKTSTGYEAKMADYMLRCAGVFMYVSELKSPKNAEFVGEPVIMDIANNMYTTDKMNSYKLNEGAYMTYRNERGTISPSIVSGDGSTVIDLYPFTEAGQVEYAKKITDQMAEVINKGNTRYGGKNGYKDILIALENLDGENAQAVKDKVFASILYQCPAYIEIMSRIETAKEYIDMDFPEFKPWNIGVIPKGEFYNPKAYAESKKITVEEENN